MPRLIAWSHVQRVLKNEGTDSRLDLEIGEFLTRFNLERPEVTKLSYPKIKFGATTSDRLCYTTALVKKHLSVFIKTSVYVY